VSATSKLFVYEDELLNRLEVMGVNLGTCLNKKTLDKKKFKQSFFYFPHISFINKYKGRESYFISWGQKKD
jgi:hypothetical protein